MLPLTRTRRLGGLALLAGLLAAAGTSRAQQAFKPVSKPIDFKTFDGVTIQGTFYPNPGGKKDAVAILLHEPDLKKGSSSQNDGWADLAGALQQQGYAVLMFDFRGFGESKTVNVDTFFKHIQNVQLIRGAVRKPSQVSYKDFQPKYLPYLVNDIAAAKAYLDRQNDQKQCNTSSVVLIGAGESAALGALWMAHEARRAKDKNNPLLAAAARPILAEPEGKDLAGAIWLTANTRLGSANVPVAGLTRDLKVPQVFVYGGGDKAAAGVASGFAKGATTKVGKDKDAGYPRAVAVTGVSSAGHRLLGKGEDGEKAVLDALKAIMEKRGSKEWTERKVDTSAFWYTSGPKGGMPLRINKRPTDDVPSVSLSLFLQGFAG